MTHSNGAYADDEVIDRIRCGETGLFEILIRRYNPYLYRIGRSYQYNHADTEDLMQDSFVDAFFHLDGFEGRASFKTWITRIMLNNCYRRKHKARSRVEVSLVDEISDDGKPLFHQNSNTEHRMVIKELGNFLENALNLLPDDYRIVFILRERNGMSVHETAEALGLSESNVKVRMNRARKMLRGELEKIYSAEDIYEFNLRYCDRMVERVMERIASPRMRK